MMNLKKLNAAESFALSRVISFPLVLLFIFLGERTFCAWFYTVMFSTDFIDGFFALFFGQESARRARLDTLGDILFLLAGMLGFYIFETAFFLDHITPISIVLGLYFSQFVLALIKWRQPSSFHTYSAKLAALVQVVFLASTLLFTATKGLFYFAVALSIIDATEDIILTFVMPKWKANIKGLLWYRKEKGRQEED